MVKIAASDIVPCIYRFLIESGLDKAAKALEKGYDVKKIDGISGVKLMRICKFYLKNHPELLEKEEDSDNEEEEEEVETHNKKKLKAEIPNKVVVTKKETIPVAAKSHLKKNQKVSSDEEEEEDSEEEKVPTKTQQKPIKNGAADPVKSKASIKPSKAAEKMEEEEESEESEEDHKSKNLKAKKNGKEEKPVKVVAKVQPKKPAESEEEDDEEEEEVAKPIAATQYQKAAVDNGVVKKKGEFFQKFQPSEKYELPVHLRDNTFEAKEKFGAGGDEYGKIGNEKLKDTRGRDFKKEKTKFKNKNFQGGGFEINTNRVNSIKF